MSITKNRSISNNLKKSKKKNISNNKNLNYLLKNSNNNNQNSNSNRTIQSGGYLNGKILVLDFDQTFLKEHSNGTPITKKIILSDADKADYIKYLTALRKYFNKIYINTRGLKAEITQWLRQYDLFEENLINDVYGADVVNKTDITVDKLLAINQENNEDESKQFWATQKVIFLNDIAADHSITDKSKIYFYDDTELNILEAKKNDQFINSFTVPITIENYKNINGGTTLLKKILEDIPVGSINNLINEGSFELIKTIYNSNTTKFNSIKLQIEALQKKKESEGFENFKDFTDDSEKILKKFIEISNTVPAPSPASASATAPAPATATAPAQLEIYNNIITKENEVYIDTLLKSIYLLPYVGIINTENLCFMNSVLQMFLRIDEYKEYILNKKYNKINNEQYNIYENIHEIYKIYINSNDNDKINITQYEQKIFENSFKPLDGDPLVVFGSQQDAIEFIQKGLFLNELNDLNFMQFTRTKAYYIDNDNKIPNKTNTIEPQKRSLIFIDLDDDKLKKYSPINQNIQYLLNETYFKSLATEINNNDGTKYTNPIVKMYLNLDNNKYLLVLLKRYKRDKDTGIKTKIQTEIKHSYFIEIPIDETHTKKVKYILRGVIEHIGSNSESSKDIDGGHYVYHWIKNSSVIKTFDDSSIKNINSLDNITKKGYVYLYERIEELDIIKKMNLQLETVPFLDKGNDTIKTKIHKIKDDNTILYKEMKLPNALEKNFSINMLKYSYIFKNLNSAKYITSPNKLVNNDSKAEHYIDGYIMPNLEQYQVLNNFIKYLSSEVNKDTVRINIYKIIYYRIIANLEIIKTGIIPCPSHLEDIMISKDNGNIITDLKYIDLDSYFDCEKLTITESINTLFNTLMVISNIVFANTKNFNFYETIILKFCNKKNNIYNIKDEYNTYKKLREGLTSILIQELSNPVVGGSILKKNTKVNTKTNSKKYNSKLSKKKN
jgi:ubiquitin C-terminal hydrolase